MLKHTLSSALGLTATLLTSLGQKAREEVFRVTHSTLIAVVEAKALTPSAMVRTNLTVAKEEAGPQINLAM